jgi:cytochrome c553
MKTVKTAAWLALAFMLCTPMTWADGDPAAGQKKSQVCQACHGADGHGLNPTYPVLAGQYQDYMVHALKAYRDGGRNNPIMAGMAAPLSDQDIEDLAAYYSNMEGLRDLSGK